MGKDEIFEGIAEAANQPYTVDYGLLRSSLDNVGAFYNAVSGFIIGIIVFAMLATTAIDIVYLNIPLFRMKIFNRHNLYKNILNEKIFRIQMNFNLGIISQAAVRALEDSETTHRSQNVNLLYIKYRFKTLVIMAISVVILSYPISLIKALQKIFLGK